MKVRELIQADSLFLKEMHYEAVYWRAGSRPYPFEQALAHPELFSMVDGWGERDGDGAVMAVVDGEPAGAAWYRFWQASTAPNGFVDEATPIVGIAVREACRQQGVGRRLLIGLIDLAAKRSVDQLSLNVTKDNHAKLLYLQLGFSLFSDRGEALTLLRKV